MLRPILLNFILVMVERVKASASETEIGRGDSVHGQGRYRSGATGCVLQGKPSGFEIVTTYGRTWSGELQNLYYVGSVRLDSYLCNESIQNGPVSILRHCKAISTL